MKSFGKEITLNLVAFSSSNYWKDENQIYYAEIMLSEIESKLINRKINCSKIIITKNEDIRELEKNSLLKDQPALFFPMSGATQELMLKSSSVFDVLGIGVTYTGFFIDKAIADKFLVKNAAPAAMDIYAVLKRTKKNLKLFSDLDEVLKRFTAKRAVERMKNSVLLRIGETEPWVISSTKDIGDIKNKLGVNAISIPQTDLEEEYMGIKESDISEMVNSWELSAAMFIDVDKKDLVEAVKLSAAVNKLAEKHSADAVSIACFNLLNSIGTTACLSVSALNDNEFYVGGCEGDVDSTLTLMLMKSLTGKAGWIANPMIEHNSALRLAHCSAPRYGNKFPMHLMKHHESGIGVSPKIFMSACERVTLARLGNNLSSINIFSGVTVATDSIETCRTQILVKLDDLEAYKEKVLGCHQVLTFGDYSEELKICADMLNLKF